MNPIVKVLIAASLVCVALYYGVTSFLGTTSGVNDSLNLKSLAHTRADNSDSQSGVDKKPEPLVVTLKEPVIASRPDDEILIEVSTVSDSADENDVIPKQAAAEAAVVPDEKIAAITGGAQETQERLKKTLGISKPLPPVRAVDVVLEIPAECDVSDVVLAPLPVKYRHESPTIKGASLQELEILVAEYRKCDGGVFHLSHNPLGREDSTPALRQRRLDELKYFFLQHRMPKTALRFPEIND